MHTEIFANGKSASFCADDRIFLGEGLFETILIDQQRPCYSSLHWQRMRQAATLLGISFEVSFDLWSRAETKACFSWLFSFEVSGRGRTPDP